MNCFRGYKRVHAHKAEWEFIQTLSYRRHLSEEEAMFVKLMYTTKLKKVCTRLTNHLAEGYLSADTARMPMLLKSPKLENGS